MSVLAEIGENETEEIRLICAFEDSASDKRTRRRARNRLALQSEILAFHLNEGLPPEFWMFFHLAMEIQVERRFLARPEAKDRDSYEARVLGQWESLRDLNDTLAPFKFHKQFVHSDDGSYRDEFVPEFQLPDEIPIGYYTLISWTSELLSANRLDSIRQCSSCHKWMAAKRDNQHSCSKACRQRYFEIRPEVRERRNATRRKSYRNQVLRAQNGLAIVKKEPRGARS